MGRKRINIMLAAADRVLGALFAGYFILLDDEGIGTVADNVKAPELSFPEVICSTPPAHWSGCQFLPVSVISAVVSSSLSSQPDMPVIVPVSSVSFLSEITGSQVLPS